MITPEDPGDGGDGPLRSSPKSFEIDACFWLLSDRRRRFCLYHLLRAGRPVEITELAAVIETAVTPADEEVTPHAVDETRLMLHHKHLPKLTQRGIVRVQDDTVRLASTPELPVREMLAATAKVELDGREPTPVPE